MSGNETREFVIVLRILCDDPEDDPRGWPFDELLAPPPGELGRFVKVETEVEVKRGSK